MIIDIFLELLTLGGVLILCHRTRWQKTALCLFAILFLSVGAQFVSNWQHNAFDKFSYLWLTSKYYPVSLDFFSSMFAYGFVAPFGAIAAICLLFIVQSREESQKLKLCALSVLHLAMIIMLVSGQNTIQILVSACFIDVLGFYLINNIAARRQYIFYNLLADMGLFMSFAMFWGDCSTNLLSKLPQCLSREHDFALWLMLLAVGIKSGLFPFQCHLMPLKTLNAARRNILFFLSTPVSGFLILYKTYGFFAPSFNLPEVLLWWGGMSIVWGALGALLHGNMAAKKLYLCQMFFGLAYVLLSVKTGEIQPAWGYVGISAFLLCCLTYAHWFLGAMWVLAALMLANMVVWSAQISTLPVVKAYVFGLAVVLGCLLPQLYRRDKAVDAVKISLLAALGAGAYMFYIGRAYLDTEVYAVLSVFALVSVLRPYRLWQKLYDNETLQNADGLSALLHFCFVSPIHFLGRILWLTIDFLIIERTLLSSLSEFSAAFSKGYLWLHKNEWRSVVVFALLGAALIVGSFYWGYK